MAERVNIAKMAEIVSKEIFHKFGWALFGQPNMSWECDIAEHDVKDHPTDVVFVYRDPFSDKSVHVLTDLKSYSASTLRSINLKEIIESLALAVDCARTNPNFEELYHRPGGDWEVQGMLFIYNHDSAYDRNFSNELAAALEGGVKIPKGIRISVFGPDDVWYLSEVLSDMATLAQDGTIPAGKRALDFHYHSPDRTRLLVREQGVPATVNFLQGRYQLIRYHRDDERGRVRGMLVYYRGMCANIREFVVLFDMLREFGVLENFDEIFIRSGRPQPGAANFFRQALDFYCGEGELVAASMKKIRFSTISSVRPRLTQFEVELRT